jgi:riboflavin biosynthesis pyrimidine reductase
VILTRAFPGTGDRSIDLDAPGGRETLADDYRPPRAQWVRLNLITTLSGSAAGADGTSESITNPIDRILLRTIRNLADVVVVGAASVRAEGYFVPKHAALAVVTRTGDLSAHNIRGNGEHGPLLVLCPAAAVARVKTTTAGVSAEVIAVPDESGDLTAPAIVRTLRDAGYPSIVAEGGPTLAALLATGGVVDELCLTTSPELGGADLPLFGRGELGPIPLELSQLLLDEAGTTYARWRVPRVR